jgi:hypothetical protein
MCGSHLGFWYGDLIFDSNILHFEGNPYTKFEHSQSHRARVMEADVDATWVTLWCPHPIWCHGPRGIITRNNWNATYSIKCLKSNFVVSKLGFGKTLTRSLMVWSFLDLSVNTEIRKFHLTLISMTMTKLHRAVKKWNVLFLVPTNQNEIAHGPCAHLGLHAKKY